MKYHTYKGQKRNQIVNLLDKESCLCSQLLTAIKIGILKQIQTFLCPTCIVLYLTGLKLSTTKLYIYDAN